MNKVDEVPIYVDFAVEWVRKTLNDNLLVG